MGNRPPPKITLAELDAMIAAAVERDEARLGETEVNRIEWRTWRMYRQAAQRDTGPRD